MSTAVWMIAFRPFFFLGALHAVVALAIWMAVFAGVLPAPSDLNPVLWHSHEMIFGFTTAIIAGFILTAAQNWTGIRGLHGASLQLLVLVWVAGRVLMLAPDMPPFLVAAVDLSFYPLLAGFMIRYLKDPELKVERIFFVLFALLFVGNLLVHLEAIGLVASGHGRQGITLGLDTVILMIVFMGGRVIPFFTESELARRQPRTWPWVEILSLGSAGLFLVLDFLAPGSQAFVGVASLAALVHLVRLYGWQVKRVRRVPLIWVLHVGYLWLVLGFLLSALAGADVLPRSAGVHAFTVGGLGVIVYGMIARVALGHTGRRLHPSAWTVAGFYLLNLAAVVRVLVPVVLPARYFESLVASSLLWGAAFVIYIVVYAPILLSPRADGRPG